MAVDRQRDADQHDYHPSVTSDPQSSDGKERAGKQRGYGPFMAAGLAAFTVLYFVVRFLLD